MIAFFGDVHFNDSPSRPWITKTGYDFLDWYKDLPINNEDNVAVFLGDLTENFLLSGTVYDMLHKLLIDHSKWKKVYVLVGNHDLKKRGTEELTPYDAFEEFINNIEILRDPAQVLEIEGMKFLSLPHYNPRPDLPSMIKYYSDLPKEITDQEYDFAIGHFADDSAPMYGELANLDKIKAKNIILGHIHVKISDHYIGSVFPNSSKENDTVPRSVWMFDDPDTKKEYVMPQFCEYHTIEFPKKLPKVKTPNPIWTIYNCKSENEARDHYGDDLGYVRKTFAYTLNNKAKASNSYSLSDIEELNNITETVKSFIKENKQIPNPIQEKLKSLFVL
jgi:hypothetical protein